MMSQRQKKEESKAKKPKVSYYSKPVDMTLREWQIALRKQYVENNSFGVKKTGLAPLWTEYLVENPRNQSRNKVALRSLEIGQNFCTCGDFKTNTLGTCKHIEAVSYYVNNKRGFKKHLKIPYSAPHSSLYLEYGYDRKVKMRIGTSEEKEVISLCNNYLDKDKSFPKSSFAKFPQFLREVKKIAPNFDVKLDVLEFIIEERERNYRTKVANSIEENWKEYFDSILKIMPYSFQIKGILHAVAAGRSLIADEMGLGKTIQAIAASVVFAKEFNIKKVLVICPTSLKYQWQAEINKFTSLTSSVIEGGKIKRRRLYKSDTNFFNIISHHLAYFDVDDLIELQPDLIILDEAQRIKNWATKISRNIKRIPSKYAIVLTGTPLENKIEELYSILQFTNPYILPPVFEFLDQHRIRDDVGKVIGYKNMHLIKEQLSPVLIRRRKEDVLTELPKRVVKNVFLPITKDQHDIHAEHQAIVTRLVNKWRRYKFLSEQDRLRLMAALNSMRMVADSTYLLDQESKRQDTKVDEIASILDEILALPDHKVVIFSEWLNMHALIVMELEKIGVDFEYLNGSVPSKKRGEMVNRFQNDASCRVFLSTDAGGTGLNLQAARHLINVDLPWNPAKLEQRIARIHRIGQKKHVSITNLISLGTIEHRMLDLLEFKSGMSAGILDNGEDTIFLDNKKMDKIMEDIVQVVMPPESTGEDMKYSTVVDEKENEILNSEFNMPDSSEQSIENHIINAIEGDDEKAKNHQINEETQDTDELLQVGLQFFSGLVNTLKDKDKTEKLIDKLISNEGGKTFVKIPIENDKVVRDIVNIISGILGKK